MYTLYPLYGVSIRTLYSDSEFIYLLFQEHHRMNSVLKKKPKQKKKNNKHIAEAVYVK